MFGVVRGTLATRLPRDVLERIAQRSTALAMRSELAEAPHGYRDAVAHAKLHLVARAPSVIEDVRLELVGDRLRYEIRFPKLRREALVTYGCAWAVLAALIVGGLLLGGGARHDLILALVVSGLICGLFAWLTLRVVESDGRDELARVVREATRGR